MISGTLRGVLACIGRTRRRSARLGAGTSMRPGHRAFVRPRPPPLTMSTCQRVAGDASSIAAARGRRSSACAPACSARRQPRDAPTAAGAVRRRRPAVAVLHRCFTTLKPRPPATTKSWQDGRPPSDSTDDPSLPSSPGAGTVGYARSWLTQMYLQIGRLWIRGCDGARRPLCSGCTCLVPLADFRQPVVSAFSVSIAAPASSTAVRHRPATRSASPASTPISTSADATASSMNAAPM